MGAVYAAQDPMGRLVALKQVHPQHLDANGLARFQREGQALAALKPHPNVVGVHALGASPQGPYLVMDMVEGETLKDHMLRTRPTPQRAVEIVAGLADGVEHLHLAGVIHRDLKPENVLIRESDGAPVITDFGLAQQAGAGRLTQTGEILGTPLYMSPEQLRGQRLNEQADVWALGAILFELLTERTPFLGKTLLELAQASMQRPPGVRKLAPGVDVTLAGIVEQALRLEPSERWSSAGALAASLKAYVRYSEGHGPAPKRAPAARKASMLLPLLGSFLLALVGVGGVSYAVLSTSEAPDEHTEESRPRASKRRANATAPVKLSALQERTSATILAALEAHDWERAQSEVVDCSLPPARLGELRTVALERCLDLQPSPFETLKHQVELLQTFHLEGAPAYPRQVEPVMGWSAYLLLTPDWSRREPELLARVWVGLVAHDLSERLGPGTRDFGPVVDQIELLSELGLPAGNRSMLECAMETLVSYQGQRRNVPEYARRVAAALTNLGAFVHSEFIRLGQVVSEPGWRKGNPGEQLLYWRLKGGDEVAVRQLVQLCEEERFPPYVRAQAAREVLNFVKWRPEFMPATQRARMLEVAALDLESPFLALPFAEDCWSTEPARARELALLAVLLCREHHARTMTLNWTYGSYSGDAAVIFARVGDSELSDAYLERTRTSHSYSEDAVRCWAILGTTERLQALLRELVIELEQAAAKQAEDLRARALAYQLSTLRDELREAYAEETGEPMPEEWLEPQASPARDE